MVLVQNSDYLNIGGASDPDGTWRNLDRVCKMFGYRAPRVASGADASGLWDSGQYGIGPITSSSWNPTGAWLNGNLMAGFPGGRVWIAGGDPSWLSVAVYPAYSPGDSLLTRGGEISWESYNPTTGGNWQSITSGYVVPGDFLMCAQ